MAETAGAGVAGIELPKRKKVSSWTIGKNLVLRAAYNYGMRQNLKTPTAKGLCGFSYGFGIKIWELSINYSRSEMHIYGSPNYFTLSTNLDRFFSKIIK